MTLTFQLRRFSWDLTMPESWIWRESRIGRLLGLKPYREDRRYSESFKTDFSDMRSLLHNVQYFLDTNVWGHALSRMNELEIVQQNQIPTLDTNVDKCQALVDELNELGFSTYLIDITTDDVRQAGMHVVRVLVPHACGNMPTAYPMLGNLRLQRAAGWDAELDINDVFDLTPLPHS